MLSADRLAASNYDPSDPAVVAGAIEAGERMDDEMAAGRSAAWVAELDEIRAELSDIASTTPFSDDVKRLIRDASITLAHAQDLMEAEGDA